MALFSSNCNTYYSVASAAVHGEAYHPDAKDDERCKVRIPTVTTCQLERMEGPDEETDELARTEVMSLMIEKGCPIVPDDKMKIVMQYNMTQYANANQEFSPEFLESKDRVSNCLQVGVDSNDVPLTIEAICNPTAEMTDLRTGKQVRSFNTIATSRLGVCDITHEKEPQVHEDARNVAAYNLEKNQKYKINPLDLDCAFTYLPRISA